MCKTGVNLNSKNDCELFTDKKQKYTLLTNPKPYYNISSRKNDESTTKTQFLDKLNKKQLKI